MTHLPSSHAFKPNLLILQFILVSVISSCNTSLIRFVTLSPSLLSLSLKISCISKSLIRGIVLSCLIQYLLLLMPPVRSTASRRCNKLILLVLFINKIMLSYSYYIKKGLLYIMIISLSSCQLLSCIKCIKVNIYSSCNICLVFNAKYKCLIIYLNYYMSCLICLRVLYLIYY